MGPQTRIIRYDPGSPLHERYSTDYGFVDSDEASLLEDMALTINSFFGWDFNSCEALRSNGSFVPIDFANACPDSQVTSLHYHFPWLVTAKVRWALFCAITKRPMRSTSTGLPTSSWPTRGFLSRGSGRVRRHCQGSVRDGALRGVLRHHPRRPRRGGARLLWEPETPGGSLKVVALFPEHEWEQFTEHFWGLHPAVA